MSISPEILQLRNELDEIDTAIIDLIARRQSVVTQIGERKHRSGKALRDFSREREVIEKGVNRAETLGIPGYIAKDILERLIHYSLSNQERRTLATSAHGQGRDALVIGGLGRMGDWMARYLDTVGYSVEVADTGTGESLFEQISDWESQVDRFDVIVVAVPLRIGNMILKRLAELKPAALVFDIGSLKSPLREGLAAVEAAGLRACSVHPMFGPNELMLSGRHILFCDLGDPDALEETRAMFAHTAADCVTLSLEEHDEVMAWVLGLSHIINIAFASTIAQSGESMPLVNRISSSTFNAQLKVATQVVSENPHLYYEIQQGNTRTGEVHDRFLAVLDELSRAVREGDEQAFVDAMEMARLKLSERPATGTAVGGKSS